ncbi:MAG: ABC transporter permease subunit [Chloroflexota bacterium]
MGRVSLRFFLSAIATIWLSLTLAFFALPVLPVIALQAGILFSGTVITETIFRRAGLGLLLLDATLERDYPIVQGIVGLTAATYIAFNSLSNLLTHWLDPRLRPIS